MIIINNELSFPLEDVLFVFALESEAADIFNEHATLFTGVGKVNAAYQLTKAIQQQRPAIIINLGSAGSSHFNKGEVVCCTHFVQRDMDVRGLGFEQYVTPFSEDPAILEYGLSMKNVPTATCGTGDSFEMAHANPMYDVVDMEAYALASVASKENIPFLCLKYISDGADDNAADDWNVAVHKAAVAYGALLKINTQ